MTEKLEGITAFIASPATEALDILKDELTKRNVKGYTAYDLPAGSLSIADHVRRSIKKADFIIAVIPSGGSPNVFFELGIAHALKKPLVVFVSPTFGNLPSDIAQTLYFRIDPKDRVALSFALDQCISRLKKSAPRSRKERKRDSPLGEEVNKFFAELKNKDLSGPELERLVIEIFKAAGAQAVIESPNREAGADIAIWSDELQAISGNPLLIEVKNNIGSRAELLNALNQVESYRQKSDSKLALLLMNAVVGVVPSIGGVVPFVGGVLPVLLPTLLEYLRTKSLSETIRELRNKAAHTGAL